MAHQFDRKMARLALEICRFTYAAGVDDDENKKDKADALNFIKTYSSPLFDPIPIRGHGKNVTSFACIVPYADRNVVSYMGTETEFDRGDLVQLLVSLRDWSNNGKARLVPFELDGPHVGKGTGVTLKGLVHEGFLGELKAVQDQIVATLKQNGGVGRPVLVTGHSQGGAEAALATPALTAAGFNVEVTYTFAAPRAGTAEFVQSVTTPVHRIEFGDDIVPHLPPTAIREALEDVVSGHPLLGAALGVVLKKIQDVGYVGLGPLCYGEPNEKKFHIDLSDADEDILFNKRLKHLSKNPKHWGDHHHLAGTTAEVTASPPQRGNYTVLVSPEPEGWPIP